MITILTGPVHSGKTSLLRELVKNMEEGGLEPGGFLSVSRWEDDLCQGYDLHLIREKRRIPFIRRDGGRDWERIGPFYFVPRALERAKNVLLREKDARPLIVDEIGPLEMGGKGLWPSFRQVLCQKPLCCIVVVREHLLESFLGLSLPEPVHVFHIQKKDAISDILENLETD